MHIGTIGASNVAQAVSRHLLAAGHTVTLSNSRGPETLDDVVAALGKGAKAGTREEAASADIVLLAVFWPRLDEALAGLPDWNNRILIDATNAFESYAPDFKRAELNGRTSSEIVAEHAPGARIVKAFNTIYYKNIEADPAANGGRRVLFISGDDAEAKAVVSDLLTSMGFAPIDIGGLVEGGGLQQLGGALASHNLIKLG